MATIEKRGKTWTVRYVVHDAYGNKAGQKRVSGFKTKEDAMAAAKDLERKTEAGIDVHGASATCGQIMEAWFQTKVGVVEETTLSNYSHQIEILNSHAIYNTPVKNLNQGSLKKICDDLKQEKGLSNRTVRDYTSPLRMSLAWAKRVGMIALNPIEGAPMPKAEKPQQTILSEPDIEEFVAKCQSTGSPFITAVYLGLYGGLCREEVAGLKWDNVDFNKGAVIVNTVETLTQNGKHVIKDPKTVNRSRTVTMPKFVMDHLKGLPHRSEYVVCSRNNKPYALYSYSTCMKRLVAGITKDRKKEDRVPFPAVSFHDLRHTHAAICIKLGLHMKVISERLGHGSIKITMDIYGYLMPGMQEQAANAIDAAWAKVGNKVGNGEKEAS